MQSMHGFVLMHDHHQWSETGQVFLNEAQSLLSGSYIIIAYVISH